MTVDPIGAACAAVYITSAELAERGLTPEALTAAGAGELARAAFARAGLPAGGRLEVEAYSAPGGVLLFARLREAEERWYSFGEWEELLRGAESLPRPRPAAGLALWAGRYWLCVREEGAGLCRLTEFGREERPGPLFSARLEEQEGFLIPEEAFRVLERHFGV